MAHIPEDARYVNPPDEREVDEEEQEDAITDAGMAWLWRGYTQEGSTECVCGNLVEVYHHLAHAETCRALRREVE